MNDKTIHALSCAGCVIAVYGLYVGGTLISGLPMPDGQLFAGVLVAVGLIFGYNLKLLLAQFKKQ